MLIIRTSPFTGKTNSWEIPVTEAQLKAWHDGMLIQRAMPELTADQREFIKTGITPAEWDELFGVGDE